MVEMTGKLNSNSIACEDMPIHGWYRFVLSYPPHLVRKYLQAFELDTSSTILDPFCGTGTTLVEAQKNGLKSAGMDAHPFAAFVSRVKTRWNLPLTKLRAIRSEVIDEAERLSLMQGLPALSFTHLLLREEQEPYGLRPTLTEDQNDLMPKGFVSPKPLKRLLLLKQAIDTISEDSPQNIRSFFYLALCHVISNGAGNFAFGPEIYRTKPKPDFDVLGSFSEQTQIMIADLEQINILCPSYVEARVHQDDARSCVMLKDRIDAVITSPPYPNEKDYTRTTRVESVLLGFLDNKVGLRAVKESLLRSNTRNVFVGDSDAAEVKEFRSIQRVCRQIEDRRIELGKTSGFERLYHKVVAHYFGGMRRHLRCLRRHLKPHANLAYVVGDQLSFLMIPVYTARLLAEVAEAEGYTVKGIDLWRERIGTKVRNSTNGQKTVRIREEVLLLQKR